MEIIKLSVGENAPKFTSVSQQGTSISLDTELETNEYVLLIFYPGDDTPGCTKQLCGVNDIFAEYENRKVKVFGVNKANAESHQKFIDKYKYQFDILVDEGNVIRDLYGAVKKYFNNFIVKRGAVLINSNGVIEYIFWGQHDNQKILDHIDSITQES